MLNPKGAQTEGKPFLTRRTRWTRRNACTFSLHFAEFNSLFEGLNQPVFGNDAFLAHFRGDPSGIVTKDVANRPKGVTIAIIRILFD